MSDLYLYPGKPQVLRNLFDIHDPKTLDLVEAEQSRANMMLLYEAGFSDFSTAGLQYIHKYLFGDVYDWAGCFRVINIQKREKILAGASVWYSDVDTIKDDLDAVWNSIHAIQWASLLKEDFIKQLVRTLPQMWKVHPFREGNTRTIVMMITFFIESYGYFVDQTLLSASAGYVRNSFVLASVKEYAEYEHLEKILSDAVQMESVEYEELNSSDPDVESSKYEKYKEGDYEPQQHEQRLDKYNPRDFKD